MSETEPDQSETHPGAVNLNDQENGWRLGVAAAWRAIKHLSGSAAECRAAIEALGNKGPQL